MSTKALVLKRTKMEIASQVMILVGAASMVFVGGGNRWGFVMALLIQPFWYYTTWRNRQWGVLSASLIYTVAWALGIYHNFDFSFLKIF